MFLDKIPRKLTAFLLTDLFLVGAAFLVKNGNFSALSTALVAAMTAFVIPHAVQDFRTAGSKKGDGDAC